MLSFFQERKKKCHQYFANSQQHCANFMYVLIDLFTYLFDVKTLWTLLIKVDTSFPQSAVVVVDHCRHTVVVNGSFQSYLRTSDGRRAWAVPQKWACSCESLARLLRCTATPPSEQTSPGRTLAQTEHTAPCWDRVQHTTQYNLI